MSNSSDATGREMFEDASQCQMGRVGAIGLDGDEFHAGHWRRDDPRQMEDGDGRILARRSDQLAALRYPAQRIDHAAQAPAAFVVARASSPCGPIYSRR